LLGLALSALKAAPPLPRAMLAHLAEVGIEGQKRGVGETAASAAFCELAQVAYDTCAKQPDLTAPNIPSTLYAAHRKFLGALIRKRKELSTRELEALLTLAEYHIKERVIYGIVRDDVGGAMRSGPSKWTSGPGANLLQLITKQLSTARQSLVPDIETKPRPWRKVARWRNPARSQHRLRATGSIGIRPPLRRIPRRRLLRPPSRARRSPSSFLNGSRSEWGGCRRRCWPAISW